jgi:TatD DNase family protein
MVVDTHCHLYLPEFDTDIDLVIGRAEKEDVLRFYLPAIDSTTDDRLLALEERFPGKCFAMMGLHPTSVKENYYEELRRVEDWFEKRSFAAVGEIGLDFYWDKTFQSQQTEAFHRQIELALEHNKPVVIHSRNAMDECIDIVTHHQSGKLKGVFHCFSGSLKQAQRIVDIGLYLGIGGVLTYKKSGLADVVSEIPLQHIVLETDSPYLSPVPFRGKRNESSYLRYVIEKLALIKNISVEEIAFVTSANAEKIFSP